MGYICGLEMSAILELNEDTSIHHLHGRLNCHTSRKLSDMSNLNERIYLQLSQKGDVKHESTKKYVRLRLKVLLREDDVYCF